VSTSFDPSGGLIIVRARLQGPVRSYNLRMAVDTGATSSLIATALLEYAGYDPATATDRTRITTGSRVESVSRIQVQRLSALGIHRREFRVLCHTLPPTTGIDGVLGLDFVRGMKLVVDFRKGVIDLK
jgi:aspartyl protease family protein